MMRTREEKDWLKDYGRGDTREQKKEDKSLRKGTKVMKIRNWDLLFVRV